FTPLKLRAPVRLARGDVVHTVWKTAWKSCGCDGTTLRFPLALLNLAAPPWRASAKVSSRRRRPRAGGMFPPERPHRHRLGGPNLAGARRVDAAGRSAGRRPDQRPRGCARPPAQAESGRRLGLREYGAAGGRAVVR